MPWIFKVEALDIQSKALDYVKVEATANSKLELGVNSMLELWLTPFQPGQKKDFSFYTKWYNFVSSNRKNK